MTQAPPYSFWRSPRPSRTFSVTHRLFTKRVLSPAPSRRMVGSNASATKKASLAGTNSTVEVPSSKVRTSVVSEVTTVLVGNSCVSPLTRPYGPNHGLTK